MILKRMYAKNPNAEDKHTQKALKSYRAFAHVYGIFLTAPEECLEPKITRT